MLLIWQSNLFLAIFFPLVFFTVECIYLSAVLTKVTEGGWVPLAFATCFLCIMYTWNYGSVLKYQSEVREKVSMESMLRLGPNLGTIRVPGIALLYNELVQGIPSVLPQFLQTLPAIHSFIVFVCIKYVPIPIVPPEERFLFQRVCPKNYRIFRCITRYGYKDVRKEEHHVFEQILAENLFRFLHAEAADIALEKEESEMDGDSRTPQNQISMKNEEPSGDSGLEFEISGVRDAMNSSSSSSCGFTYLLGHGEVRARKESWFLKKLVINYVYAFLRRNCRAGTATMRVPHTNIVQVGITYMV